ncbi:MAG: MFS transporter [Planctomycetota bacterium]
MLNPLRGVPNPAQVTAWGMFDLANQSFTLLINTLLFPIFFKEVVVGDGLPGVDQGTGDMLWSITVAISLAIVVLLSPLAGAIGDVRAIKKPMLLGLGMACVACTCALALVPDGRATPGVAAGAVALAMLLYIPANVAYQLGENFLASFLPEIATRQNMGRVSGIGWSMGYLGALLLLAIVAGAMFVLNIDEVPEWRPIFIFAGLWFLAMATPTAIVLREKAKPTPLPPGASLVGIGFTRLRETAREASHFRQLATFFSAFLVYGFGVQVIVFFAGVLAKDFGFENIKLVGFTLQLTVLAGVAAIVTAMFQDRFGHKRTILAYLVIWLANALGLAWLASIHANAPDPSALPEWPVWMVGNGIGLGLGGIGTASRSMVGALTPAHRTAEFFGLWGLVYKLAGCIGVLSFGLTAATSGRVASLLLLAAFFLSGAIILLFVNQAAGERAADDSERAHARETDLDDLAAEARSEPLGKDDLPPITPD